MAEHIRQQLNEKDGFQVWWRLLRPHTLTASFVPVFVGTMLAYIYHHEFHLLLFLAMMIASILIQAATNMFNEYYDYKLGLDNEESVGIGGTIVRDGVKPETVKHLAFTFFAIAGLLGIYICLSSSLWIAVIGIVSMAVGYFYTGGPWPIAYTPFGELFSGFCMGPVIIGISFFIQTGTVTWQVFFVSIPIALFIASLMTANNIRDRVNDAENGRKTIAILLGHNGGVAFLASMFALAFIITIVLVFTQSLPYISLISLLAIPKAVQVIKGYIGKIEPLEMMPAMAATGKTNTIYGLLLGLSLFIHSFFI